MIIETDKLLVEDLIKKDYENKILDLIKEIETYLANVDKALILKAFNSAYDAHFGILRKSGEPYFEHCYQVAKILCEFKRDQITIIAGLLHDVVEDTKITPADLSKLFGEEVSRVVDGVTKISSLKMESREHQQAHNIRKMLVSMIGDIRVIFVKFADRLHNMKTLEFQSKASQNRIAIETRDVYAPLAHRLGIGKIKTELEDLSLKFTEPEIFNEIQKKLDATVQEREQTINEVTHIFNTRLSREEIKFEISGRVKNIYSIYGKMYRREKPFDEIYDILAIRIIVPTVNDCWTVLGFVHNNETLPFVQERFKDYISRPKGNGYQSLHTAVTYKGNLVEVQIRTKEMHEVAEEGFAAHWIYKSNGDAFTQDKRLERRLDWLRNFVDDSSEIENESEFLDDVKGEFYQEEIYVYTPLGKLVQLPVNSTTVDFAFEVHSEIGKHCLGAKVNGKMVPLATELKNGDMIEIITSSKQVPNPDWLGFVKSPKAKRSIKRWIEETEFEDRVKLGSQLLNEELKKRKIDLKTIKWEEAITKFQATSQNNLFARIGTGKISVQEFVNKTFGEKVEKEKQNFFSKLINSKPKKNDSGISVQGITNVLISYAKCCKPIPGDEITGILTVGKGVSIHRIKCKNLAKNFEGLTMIDVKWDSENQTKFSTGIIINSKDRAQLLSDLSNVISGTKRNIQAAFLKTEGAICIVYFLIEIQDVTELNAIIKAIRKVSGVSKVERMNDDLSNYFKDFIS